MNWWTWQGFEDNPVQMSDGNEAVVSEEMRDNPDIIQEAPSESPKPKNEEPHSSVPEAHFPKNTPEVSYPITLINDLDNSVGYTLPFRHNRGKPPHRYTPDFEKKKIKIPDCQLCVYLGITRTTQGVCA